jgi:DNA primase
LVEGPGDVWRLEEAGIQNSVAMFGVNLTDEQAILLECSGAMTVVLAEDNDAAGEIAINELKDQLRGYNLKVYKPSAKDVGEMTIADLRKELVPLCQSSSISTW